MNEQQNPSNPFAPPPPPPAYDPYRAPQAPVSYSPTGGGRLELAEPVSRLLARLIDGFLALGLMLPGIILVLVGSQDGEMGIVAIIGALLIFGAMIALLVYQLRLLAASGQTFGRVKQNVRIVRSNGTPATLGRLIGYRWFITSLISAIPILGSIFGLVNILMIFRQDRRCAHDHIADTIVVKA
jgi:uncharacterized RDD family membrane protein YckC